MLHQAQVKSILVDPNIDSTYSPVLTLIVSDSFAVYDLREDQLLDDGSVEIPWSLETGFTSNEDGSLYTFAALMLRIALKWAVSLETPTTAVTVVLIPLDEASVTTTVGTVSPTSRPGKWYSLLSNFVAEHVRIKISGYNQVLINRLVLFVSKRAEQRPR